MSLVAEVRLGSLVVGSRLERLPPGLIGTVKDDDGNYVRVIELADRAEVDR